MERRFLWMFGRDHMKFAKYALIYWAKPCVQPHDDPEFLFTWIAQCLNQRKVSAKDADAAVMMLLTDENPPRMLLTKRAAQLTSHAGEVAFPGGKRDTFDLSNVSVALREMHEEVGIDPHHVRILGVLPKIRSASGLMVRPVVGVIPANTVFTLQEDEIEEVFLVPLPFFLQTSATRYRVQFRQNTLHVPAFLFEDYVIWGLTSRIIVSFLRIVFRRVLYWPFLYLPLPFYRQFSVKASRRKGS